MPNKVLIEIIRKAAVSFMFTALFAILGVTLLLLGGKKFTDPSTVAGLVLLSIAAITGIFHFMQVHISEHYLTLINSQKTVIDNIKRTNTAAEMEQRRSIASVPSKYSAVKPVTDDTIGVTTDGS